MTATEFKNKMEIYNYLKSKGWGVSRPTVYRHAKDGFLRPDRETGVYTIKSVEKYALQFLKRKDTQQKIETSELQDQKLKAEVGKLEEQAQLARLKRKIEEGRYVLREDLDLELAARAATLEAGFKSMIQEKAGDWILLVEGDEQRTGELIRKMVEGVDGVLNEFASTREFHVIFKVAEI